MEDFIPVPEQIMVNIGEGKTQHVRLEIYPLKVKHWPLLFKLVGEVGSEVFDLLAGGTADGKNAMKLFTLIDEHQESLFAFIAKATNLEIEMIEEMDGETFIIVLRKLVEVNHDFLQKRILPHIESLVSDLKKKQEKKATGAKSSKK